MVFLNAYMDFFNEINAFNIIVEEYIGNFIFGNFVIKNILCNPQEPIFEPYESQKKFLKVWSGKENAISKQIDQDFNILIPTIKESNKQISKLCLPRLLQNKQIEKYSNIPNETLFYSRWMALPNSLINKLIYISPKLQNYLSLFTDIMRTFLPFVILGVIKPKTIQNQQLKNLIIGRRKTIQLLLSRHSEFDSMIKDNGTL